MECIEELEWTGLYHSDSKYKKYLDPKTYAHPAKMSMALCDKIFKHLEQIGLLKKDDVVVDFMSGTGRTNVIASLHGYKSIGVELESHFIDMQNDNKKVLEKQINKKADWEILQGDSRHLSELLKEKGVGVISPPYADQNKGTKPMHERTDGLARRLVKDRPNMVDVSGAGASGKAYAGITSPPYIAQSGGTTPSKEGVLADPKLFNRHSASNTNAKGYTGTDNAQIGNLKDSELVGITSPPYEKTLQSRNQDIWKEVQLKARPNATNHKYWDKLEDTEQYGTSEAQIGNDKSETYLTAMLQVYQEAYKAGISPLVTVTKNPTKKGQLRRLDLDTARLLEMAGYTIVDYHRAILWKEVKQKTLAGGVQTSQVGRLSFFKRMSVAKGNVAAKWEDIIISII